MSSSKLLTFKVDLEDGSITWSNGVSKSKSHAVALIDDHKGLRFVKGVVPGDCQWRSYKEVFGPKPRRFYLGQVVTVCTRLAEFNSKFCKVHSK